MKSYRHLLLSVALVLCLPVAHAQVTLNQSATRALGAARLEQLTTGLTNAQPNLVEGREFNAPQGIALDLTSTPIHLYVADSLNNRVLAWKDATAFNNGAFADLVIGQSDLFTTIPQGPGRAGSTRPSSGLTAPMGMTVDATGNLYVIDAGNNRVLRFPKPFAQTGEQFPDMVIGQQNFSSIAANANGISASTVNFASGGAVLTAYLKFDSFQNLWLADVGNQRVLRYPASALATGANGPNADLVLGQPDFATNSIFGKYDPTSLTTLYFPTGICFDKTGRLFIVESQPTAVRSRILVFQPPYSSNQPAQRIIGTVLAGGTVQPPVISEQQLANGAGDCFNVNNNMAVADTQNNRILVYQPFEQFDSNTLTQKAQVQIGQVDFNSGKPNRGNSDANSNTLQLPSDAAFSGTELYIADGGNNRVIVMPMTPNSSTLGFNSAVRLLGQQAFSEQAPNYIEGREFDFTTPAGGADAGIAIDVSSNPPHLYVADTYNNRILCFTDARKVQTGDTATFVLGQPDLFHAVVNYNPSSTTSSANTPTSMGLFHPTGLAVDSAGNLYVADSGNSRVLRFPTPFLQPTKLNQPADLVLGQSSFTNKITDVSGARMFQPYGIAIAKGVGILVSDLVDNRILLFAGPNYTNGMTATAVWGQPNFSTAAPGGADNRFTGPHGIAVDSSYRLYVADSGNSRVLVFDDIRKVGSDPHSIVSLSGVGGLTSPRAIVIDQYTPTGGGTLTDEIWIGDSGKALRFSGGYDNLYTSNFTPDEVIVEAGGAVALAIDNSPLAQQQGISGALFVADLANRVVIHYVDMTPLNAASYNTVRTTVSPNSIISLFSKGGTFGEGTQAFSTLPLPTTMQAIQVLLNGTAMPLYYVSPSQINFLIPNNAPTTGTADLQVVRTDNGQTLGDTTITMTTYAPGIFTTNGSGKGQAAAINDDGTANGPSNPISRGHVLQVYGTGLGLISGAPNDGSAVSTATPTPAITSAKINGIDCTLQYSGLAPGQVGVWQANVVISDAVPPTSSLANRTSELVLYLNGVPSGGAGLFGIQVTVWVKQ
jgi:uncharacterized protein (TIGR03437 family)